MPDSTKLRPATTGTAYGDNVANSIDKLVEKTSYTYDGFNRLKKTETIKDSIRTIAEYIYNGEDLRVRKTVKNSNNNYIAEVTNYQYDRQNVILETDANNNIQARYIKGINYIAKTDAKSNTAYFLFNGHGDVVQTVDEAGTLQNQYDYDIWGNPTLTIETTSNAIRYAGEFLDNETGLYYLRARYYDPYIGRFISEDSYWGEDSNPLSLNLYTYCENDPIRYVDPTGHMSANELDWLFGKGASQLFDEDGNYKDGTVPMMVEGIGIITDVACSEALNSQKYGYTFMTPDSKVYGNIDNYSNNIDVINTLAGSNTTITNHEGYTIRTINTGDNSYTTINNRGIIDTINTGKSSSLVLDNGGKIKNVNIGENGSAIIYNQENAYINTIKGGDIESKDSGLGMYIFDFGDIDNIYTGKNSTNLIINPKSIGNLMPGDNNTTDYTGVINSVVDNVKSSVTKNGKLTEKQIKNLEDKLNAINGKDKLTETIIKALVDALNVSGNVLVTYNSNTGKYEVKNKGTGKTITSVIYLINPDGANGFGHSAIMLKYSDGSAVLYSYVGFSEKVVDLDIPIVSEEYEEKLQEIIGTARTVAGYDIPGELRKKELTKDEVDIFFGDKTVKDKYAGYIYDIPNYNGTPNYYGDDTTMDPYPYDKYIIIPVSAAEGEKMLTKAESIRSSPGKYNLYEHNCNMVVQTILEAGEKNFVKTNWNGYSKNIRAELSDIYADFNESIVDTRYLLPWEIKELQKNTYKFIEQVKKKVKKYEDIGLIPKGAYEIGTKKGYEYGTIKK